MNERKYQVFISSTYVDLADVRSRIINAVLNMHHFPVGMEMFPADDDEQWTFIRELIRESDYYVVIIGHRYGSIASDGVSFTEREYDYACALGVPVLAFIRDDNVPLTPQQRETEADTAQKIQRFRQKASGQRLVKFWETVEELETQVTVALYFAFLRHPRTGWIRADQGLTETVTNELAQLSKENRALQAQIARLQTQVTDRHPDILLSLNGVAAGSEDTVQWSVTSPDSLAPIPIPLPLSMDDVDGALTAFVTQQDLDDYNQALPTPDDIQRYQTAMEEYQSLVKNAQRLEIGIHNRGTAKANDLRIEVVWPAEFRVLSQAEFNRLDSPVAPVIPENPIPQARNTMEITQEYRPDPWASPLPDMAKAMNAFAQGTPSSPLRVPGWLDEVTVESQTVRFRLKGLLHSYQMSFNQSILIVPSRPGLFTAEVRIMCEEFMKPMVQSITVVVE